VRGARHLCRFSTIQRRVQKKTMIPLHKGTLKRTEVRAPMHNGDKLEQRRHQFSLSPQRGEGRGEGWECPSACHREGHTSPSIPSHEPELWLHFGSTVKFNAAVAVPARWGQRALPLRSILFDAVEFLPREGRARCPGAVSLPRRDWNARPLSRERFRGSKRAIF
jgi:hypothetical protein